MVFRVSEKDSRDYLYWKIWFFKLLCKKKRNINCNKFGRCERLTNAGLSGFADGLKRLGSLQELELDFRR